MTCVAYGMKNPIKLFISTITNFKQDIYILYITISCPYMPKVVKNILCNISTELINTNPEILLSV